MIIPFITQTTKIPRSPTFPKKASWFANQCRLYFAQMRIGRLFVEEPSTTVPTEFGRCFL